jgi:hypothetical protein
MCVQNGQGTTMGKAADNERVKLRATYLNNIGAGLIVGGVIVPALTFAVQELEMTSKKGIIALGYLGLTVVASLACHGLAMMYGKDIQD